MTRYGAAGTLLKIGDGSGTEIFTTIAQVISISGPSSTMETADSTDHDTADNFRTFIGLWNDGGEVTLSLHFDPELQSHVDLREDHENLTLRNFKLEFAMAGGDKIASFAALVTQPPNPTADVNDKLVGDVTLKISGKPTWGTT